MTPQAIPARAGLGLKPQHYNDITAKKPELGFFEIHAENYMGDGGLPHDALRRIRADYPLSLHGVGLSIGGERPLDLAHLGRLRELNLRYEPGLFSEHLAWSSHDQGYLADLLPLPYTAQTLARVAAHITQTQDHVGRQMLLENPSSYAAFTESEMTEPEFIRAVVSKTGCALLLDVNNVFISARNLGFAPEAYIDAYPLDQVREVHLAGHTAGPDLIIDDHASDVREDVWSLYDYTIARAGPLPTLIERDANVPPLDELLKEAARADAGLARAARKHAA